MNTVKTVHKDPVLVQRLLRAASEVSAIDGPAAGIARMSAITYYEHREVSRSKLALALFNHTSVWDELVADVATLNHSELSALVMSGPYGQARTSSVANYAPISLPVGEAGTWTPIQSETQLKQVLQTEPLLVERLMAEGSVMGLAPKVAALLQAAPSYLMDEIFLNATFAKWVSADKKAKVMIDGEMVTVKAHAYRSLTSLFQVKQNAWLITAGLSIVAIAVLKTAHRYAGSAIFWQEIPPAKLVALDEQDQVPYAGGEEIVWSSPLKTYRPGGLTNQEVWDEKERAKEEIIVDFQIASEEAYELFIAIKEVAEAGGFELTYSWEFISEGVFQPITDLAEAEDHLMANDVSYKEKKAAGELGISQGELEQHGLVQAVLNEFTPEEAKELKALRKELGHE